MSESDRRQKIVDAFLALLTEHEFAAVSLAMIAERAGLGLGDVRAEFDGRTAILAAFAREVDRKVLDGVDPQMAGEPARDRLFDVLMRRIDVLGPHKAAIRALDRALRRDPTLGLAWMPAALASHRWMLAAAEIDGGGLRGALALRGSVLLFARVLRVWLDDDDPGMARTMAALDKELRRAESTMRRLDDVARLTSPLKLLAERLCERWPRRRNEETTDAPTP